MGQDRKLLAKNREQLPGRKTYSIFSLDLLMGLAPIWLDENEERCKSA